MDDGHEFQLAQFSNGILLNHWLLREELPIQQLKGLLEKAVAQQVAHLEAEVFSCHRVKNIALKFQQCLQFARKLCAQFTDQDLAGRWQQKMNLDFPAHMLKLLILLQKIVGYTIQSLGL